MCGVPDHDTLLKKSGILSKQKMWNVVWEFVENTGTNQFIHFIVVKLLVVFPTIACKKTKSV